MIRGHTVKAKQNSEELFIEKPKWIIHELQQNSVIE